jgi:pimeloyl-ACP methyl ester carboxylesterase
MSERVDVWFPSGDGECSAWFYRPAGEGPFPVVVMAHGLGATKEMGLAPYADTFVAAGYACLVFDYRHFGASSGEPRQLLSVPRQREDWRSAVAYARTRPETDADRVALWGTSFAGGHVLRTAAEIPVAAAIVQCPFTDGLSSVLAIPRRTAVRLAARAVRDRVSMMRHKDPVMVALVGDPGETALMTAEDVVSGFLALVPDGVSFRNEVAARVAFDILRDRPGAEASRVQCPLHVTVCQYDSVAPARVTSRLVRRAPDVEVLRRPCGHFDIYTGRELDRVVEAQLAFLRRNVPVAAR